MSAQSPSTTAIRVLIADDSSFARSLLRAILEAHTGIVVAGEASNGQQALELAESLRPDVITMDLEMPRMGGLEAIEAIMCSRAVPILVVSSAADAQQALEAIALGAIEVVPKPDTSLEAAAHLASRVRLLAGVSVITRPRRRDALPTAPALAALSAATEPVVLPAAVGQPATGANGVGFAGVLAIASSTGGPQALAQILPQLPASFAWPVVVAQHISDGFAQGMVDWLASISTLPVHLMQDGQLLQPGHIYIAPSEYNAQLTPQGLIRLLPSHPTDLYHPSCDMLLQSVAAIFSPHCIGLILSGMGHDGPAGIAAIRARGGFTLAQDEASSVVYGMNRCAVEQGAVRQVLPLAEIAPRLGALVRYGWSGFGVQP